MSKDDPKTDLPEPDPAALAIATPSGALASAAAADAEASDEARAADEEAEALEEAVPEATDWRRHVPLALAAIVPVAFFFLLPPLTKSGLWDPFELNVADLARRVAINVMGASQLALEGADNGLPHLNDLGRPELPFDSIAVGFKLFGLHEWAGRVPLALWGLAGVLATYAFVSKLVDKRAGLYAAVALTTMPLYFVQARTMLGDVVSMASFAMAFGGLAVLAFAPERTIASSIGFGLMALLGLGAGWESRGGLLSVAAPTLGVATAWAVARLAGSRGRDVPGAIVAGVAGAVGLGTLVMALQVLAQDKVADLSPWLGAMVKAPSKYPTFDYYIGHIAHACAPWSAFVPFAIGRMFVPPVGKEGSALKRETDARAAIVVGATFAFFAHAWLGARTELIPFTGIALLAAACGVAIRDYERGAHPSIAVGVGTLVFCGLLHHDFHELPEKAYQAFGVTSSTFPETFKNDSLLLWTAALVGFAALGLLTWVERKAKRTPFDPAEYLKILRALRDAWDGLLALTFFALVAGFSLGAFVIWLGVKTHAHWLPALSLQMRDILLNLWWAVAFVPLGAILGIFFACDVFLWAFGRAEPLSLGSLTRGFEPFEKLFARLGSGAKSTLPGDETNERLLALVVLLPFMVLAVPAATMYLAIDHGMRPVIAAFVAIPSGVALFLAFGLIGDLLGGKRAAFMPIVGVLSGLVLCWEFYPALANQLSPKEVFESYQRIHKSGEPLALFGVGGKTAAYYAGGQPPQIKDPEAAYQWLSQAEPGTRRYVAMKSDELAKLNKIYREHSEPRINLPVLDSRSSQIILAASNLAPGDKEQNQFDKVVLDAPPSPQHKLDVNMDDKLQVLGYDTTDESGHTVNVVAPGRDYRMRTYYRVLAPVTTEWEAFIHIDGFHRRHNGDHKPMEGKYPFSLWLPGDLLVDDYPFKLEPNFSPGNYTVYFGLFVGDTRLKVKSGPSDGENRINGGTLRVQ